MSPIFCRALFAEGANLRILLLSGNICLSPLNVWSLLQMNVWSLLPIFLFCKWGLFFCRALLQKGPILVIISFSLSLRVSLFRSLSVKKYSKDDFGLGTVAKGSYFGNSLLLSISACVSLSLSLCQKNSKANFWWGSVAKTPILISLFFCPSLRLSLFSMERGKRDLEN